MEKPAKKLDFRAILFLMSLGTLLPPCVVSNAQADLIQIGPPSVESVEPLDSQTDICGPFDPECRRRLAKILSGIQILPIEMTGATAGVIRFGTRLVGVDAPAGDLEALLFDISYLPEQSGYRVRFSLAQSEVLFFCSDEKGQTAAPGTGLIGNCKPDAKWGVGGSLAKVQWDSSQWAARWIEIAGVLNLLSNGNSLDYLKERLNLVTGASVDTIRGETLVRGNFGISGMVRSENNHWELRAMAAYRPNLVAWDQYSFESRAQVLYHLLLAPFTLATVGLDTQYTYSSSPGYAFIANPFGQSNEDTTNPYLGLLFGVVRQKEGFAVGSFFSYFLEKM